MAKAMLLPSARSKFIKDENMTIILKALWIIAIFMTLQNTYLYGIMYGVKLALMVILSVISTREMEILFYTHNKNINRSEAKELIVKSYPEITALIFVLLLPIGMPLWLVALGAVLATLLGKLLFGGFHHMIFHTSMVGVILMSLGWTGIVRGVAFEDSLDNYLLKLIFDNAFFKETLHLGGVYLPSAQSALDFLASGSEYHLASLFFGLNPGVIASAFLLILVFAYFIYKKVIDIIVPVTAIVTLFVTLLLISIFNGYDLSFSFYHLFSGSFLFVSIFVLSDPITTPVPNAGKIIFGIVVGALTVFIRQANVYTEGVIFAVLLMNMLTPMLNETLKEKKKTPVKVVKQDA